MKILEVLNRVTEQLNKAADNLTNNSSEVVSENNNSIDGLGELNGTTAYTTVNSNSDYKIDNRKLKIDINSKNDDIKDWLISTGLFSNVTVNQSLIHVALNKEKEKEKEKDCGSSFIISVCSKYEELDNTMKNLSLVDIENKYENKVILGFMNYTADDCINASRLKIELMGMDEILNINNAIDLADKNLPYLSIGKNTLSEILATELYNKYKSDNKYTAEVNNKRIESLSEKESSKVNLFKE